MVEKKKVKYQAHSKELDAGDEENADIDRNVDVVAIVKIFLFCFVEAKH